MEKLPSISLYSFNRIAYSALAIAGISTEQLIHIPGLRNTFGQTIGEYAGDFTLGATIELAGLFALSSMRALGSQESTAFVAKAIVVGAGLSILICNEVLGIGPGIAQPGDLLAPLVGALSIACGADLLLHTKPKST